jgi:ribonuclease BN (tRNA processing enzyme)
VRLTVIGCGTAQPQPDTPASGLLVESGDARILLDCGQGVISRLRQRLDPRTLSAVIVGHLHADHYIDIVGLRYLFPWGDRIDPRLAVHLPPGGRDHLVDLAAAISERPGFFDDSFEVADYDPSAPLRIGDVVVRFIAGQHYVPAWGVELTDAAGSRLVYAGDTGPNPELVDVARGADLFVCEATLDNPAHDDPRRGHVTVDEAIDMAEAAGVARALIVHYPTALRPMITDRCADRGGMAVVGVPGTTIDLADTTGTDTRPAGDATDFVVA